MLDLTSIDQIDPRRGEQASRKPQLTVIMAAPRGFCAGVRRAIDAVLDAISVHGSPVYVRRAIVHNLAVVRQLEEAGAVFVEELDQVPAGSTVLFSAHGVAPAIERDARERGLKAYDAVCPLVSKVHREVERHSRNGREVILVGHRGHPEIEGTLGHAGSGTTHVVASTADVSRLPIANDRPTAYAVQTTYSVEDALEIVEALRARFSDLAEPAGSDICYATTNRQAAVTSIAGSVDSFIVAGEDFSSNACRLAEVASRYCSAVQLVAQADRLDWSLVPGGGKVGITAAASTPETVVQGIVDALAERFDLTIEDVGSQQESAVFKRLAVA